MTGILKTVSCLDDYDPDALRVDKAIEAIRACLSPVAATERIAIRQALGRVLAEDIVPSINVPAHDNSAMDGYAVRFSDLDTGETALTEVGTAFAGRVFDGKVGARECVRVMTGAVMPAGTDTVVIQEVARKDGHRVLVPPGQKKAQNVRYAGEDLKAGIAVLHPGRQIGPADLGPDWLGGFFCPCHQSKFDLAGRVYRGVPAPLNLVIPPYKYATDTRIVIGDDGKKA